MNNAVSRSDAGQYWMLGVPLLVLGLITFGVGGIAAGVLGLSAARAGEPGGKALTLLGLVQPVLFILLFVYRAHTIAA